MTALFISYVCDYCDGLKSDEGGYDCGYVVWRSRPTPAQEFVFATRADAETWRLSKGRHDCAIRKVLSSEKFRWRKSRGAVKGLDMSDRLIEIYPNEDYAPGPHRAHLSDTQ